MKGLKNLFITVLIIAATFSQTALACTQEYTDLRMSVFRIRYDMEGFEPYYGTTFYIGDGYYVTSAHVVNFYNNKGISYKAKVSYEQQNTDGTVTPIWTSVELVFVSKYNDVAVLKGSDELNSKAKALNLNSKEDTGRGDTVKAVGYPGGKELSSVKLKYVGIGSTLVSYCESNTIERKGVIITDGVTIGGMSGGPLLNKKGEVIGVLMSTGANQSQSERVALVESIIKNLKVER